MGDDDRRLRPGGGCAAAAACAGRVRLSPHPGLIRSGSLTPGIDPAAFGLPPGTALRFERPAAALRALIPAYAVLDADPAVWTGPDDWVLPGRAQMWIILADGPVTARMRRRAPVQLGQAVVFGPTSNPVPFAGSGGVSIAVELSPAGWARLGGRPAAALRDRVEPAAAALGADALGRDWTAELIARLHGSDRAEGVAPLLDAFFLDRLPPAHADEADATAVAAALERDGLSLGDAAATLGLSRWRVGRLSERYLGHAPGIVRRRARLLRALAPALMADAAMPVVPPGYHDAPHLGRDAREFLTMTARRFLALPMPYLRAALRMRAAVIGAPLAVLDAD